MKYKIAIQGIKGCFHEAAARDYFKGEEIETIECETFPDMFVQLNNDASMLGIMAIENTIAGSILPNHELLRKNNMEIIGEYKMRISHVLCALPGQTIAQLKEVNSHPMALMQCEQFLSRYPNLKMIEQFDTAGSAMEIKKHGLKGHAAICGEYAANLYGLNILAREIETNKKNSTRFLILADPLIAKDLKPRTEELNKSSVEFTLPHTHGALSKILTILSFYDINLSKIQSLPIIGREWEYRFYVDLTFESYVRYKQAIDAIRPLLNDFRILGEYLEYKKTQKYE